MRDCFRVFSTIQGVLLAALVCLPLTAQAQSLDPPDEEVIADLLKENLPPFWTLDDLEILATVNDGDQVAPRLRMRIEAEIETAEALYLPAPGRPERTDPFILLVETVAQGAERKIFGTAHAWLAEGRWQVRIDIENGIGGLGQSRGAYLQPALVAGTGEAEAALARIAEAEAFAARIAAERSAVLASLERDFAELQRVHAAKLREMEAAHAGAVEALRIRQERAIAALQETVDGSIEAAGLAARKAALDKEIALLDEVLALEAAKGERLEEMRKVAEAAAAEHFAVLSAKLAEGAYFEIEMIRDGKPSTGGLQITAYDAGTGATEGELSLGSRKCAVKGELNTTAIVLTGKKCSVKIPLEAGPDGRSGGTGTFRGRAYSMTMSFH